MAAVLRLAPEVEATVITAIKTASGTKTINALARELGRSHHCIERVAKEHGLAVAPRRIIKPSALNCGEIERLAKLGWIDAEIAERLDLTHSVVFKARREYGLAKGRPSAPLIARASTLAAEGAGEAQIVARTDCPPHVAVRLVRRQKGASPPSLWVPVGLYADAKGNKVFIASNAMHRLHQASKLSAIAERTGIDLQTYDNWKRRHHRDEWPWLEKWLSGKAASRGRKCRLESRKGRSPRPAKTHEFIVTPEMQSFRRESGKQAIERAAGRQAGKWLRKFPEMEGWMLRNDKPPHRVLSANATCRLHRAWHVPIVNRAAKTPWRTDWHRTLPTTGLSHWLTWLYGGDAPAGWYIVPERVYALKRRLSLAGRARASRIDAATQRYRDRHGRGKDTIEAGLKDVGLALPAWERCLADAATVGGDDLRRALVEYVESRLASEPRRRTGVPPRGLALIPGLFVPSVEMLKFREAARKLRAGERLAEIEADLTPELLRRMLTAFVLRDGPVGERLLADPRTFADPRPIAASGNASNGQFQPAATKRGAGRRPLSPEQLKEDAKIFDRYRQSNLGERDFARALGGDWTYRKLRKVLNREHKRRKRLRLLTK